MMDQRILRIALLSNAAFSSLTGAVLLLAAPHVNTIIGLDASGWLRALGAGLLFFAIFVISVGARRRIHTLRALLISAADLGWVAGSLSLIILAPSSLIPEGRAFVMGIGIIVLVFAVSQVVGVKRQLRETTPGMGAWRYCVAVDVEAPAGSMWRIVSDIGAISNYMPALKSAEICDGGAAASGAVRVCTDVAGQRWGEECIRFDDAARRFDLRFLTEGDGFPYPMSTMYGGWQVLAQAKGSRVIVWWSATPLVRFVPQLLAVALMGAKIDKTFPAVIQRMAAAALGRSMPTVAETRVVILPC
jgi:hypothetical protein